MRVDQDTSIHDLTDTEAADLRTLCEAMLRRERPAGHPLFLAWADATCPEHARVGATGQLVDAFLPRALHALLRRAETKTRRPSGLDDAVSKVLRATQGSSGGGYPCGPYWVDERDMDALRRAYGR